MRTSSITKILVGGAVVVATCAIAAKPADVIAARQANYKQIGKAMKGIGDELRKPEPSVPVIQASAKTIVGLAPHVLKWFPKGTGPEAGVKTGALPAVWEKWPDFKIAAVKMFAASKALDAAAATGDLAKIKPAVGALGGTCKGCHETFRAKDS
ncbi:cytochrome c [Sphingomonas sp. SUN039]|uniref:c-type cytochrome n=1 Tax=Sphingomonas sp. SUN039 TaxID=2937787 RepID=UPI0021640922|nr:cytochrome c [Sphingomonas sp. SUN039]UVO52601.1 cytochrome c [Sphingomonas sp. SUN039]